MPRRPELSSRKLHVPQEFIKLAEHSREDGAKEQVLYNELTKETVMLEAGKVLGVGFVGFVVWWTPKFPEDPFDNFLNILKMKSIFPRKFKMNLGNMESLNLWDFV